MCLSCLALWGLSVHRGASSSVRCRPGLAVAPPLQPQFYHLGLNKDTRTGPLNNRPASYSSPPPEKPKKSPAPLFHAAKREVRKALWEAYAWFVAAFREAAERLREEDRNAGFPVGSFPPHLPFVTGDSA